MARLSRHEAVTRTQTLRERVAIEREHASVALAKAGRFSRGADRTPRRRRYGLPLGLTDLTTLTLAAVASLLGEGAILPAGAGPIGWMIVFVVVTLCGIAGGGGYRFRLQTSPFESLGLMIVSPAVACTMMIGLRTALNGGSDPAAAPQTLRLWAFATVYLLGGRVAAGLVRQRSARGHLNTLIVGAGLVGNTLARRLLERPQLGLRPVGFIDDDPLVGRGDRAHGLPVVGSSEELERLVDDHDIEHVILAFSTAGHSESLDIVRRCRELGVAVSLVPRLFEEMSGRISVEHVGGIAMLRVDRADPRGWQFELKYAADRLVAALLLVLVSPLMVILALAVRLSSAGPTVFRQRRVGLDGREFDIFKFRTMRESSERDAPDAETDSFALWLEETVGEVPGDAKWIARAIGVDIDAENLLQDVEDRRTPLGRFLRDTSLDELPQLFNVVFGQMSLIGPRPERPGCADMFGKHVYRYGDRHRVKSGVTGWAQVNGLRGDTSLEDRIEWDNFYIENWSPWLDLKILLLTPAALVGHD